MILYPAIDLKGGQCVRLLRGDMDKATVFNTDPAAQALKFSDGLKNADAKWIHVVDLDGAVSGISANENAIRAIRDAVGGISLQVGGGIRTEDAVKVRFDLGIDRIVVGTVALHDPAFVMAMGKKYPFPGGIAVGIDARDGKVAVQGWTEQSNTTAIDLATKFEGSGVTAIIYTDIDRDGMMQGVNVEATARLASHTSIPIIASGGVSSLGDIRKLKDKGIAGAILGRALYERKFTLADALKAAA